MGVGWGGNKRRKEDEGSVLERLRSRAALLSNPRLPTHCVTGKAPNCSEPVFLHL